MDWSHFMSVLTGVAVTRAYMGLRVYMKTPYRWRCPDCNFKASTSHKEAMLTVKAEHNRSFHFDEEQPKNIIDLKHIIRLSDGITLCEAERLGLGADFVMQDIENYEKPMCPDCYRILTSDIPLI
jgi:hypothetical protein